MKVAILANNNNSYVKITAEGLKRMFLQCQVKAKLFYKGLSMLEDDFPKKSLKGRFKEILFKSFINQLGSYDLIIIVAGVPNAFLKNRLGKIEFIRKVFPQIPIVNYSNYYLPTINKWGAMMLKGRDDGFTEEEKSTLKDGFYGMERYDWYLAASVVSVIPLSSKKHPYSRIGMNLDDKTLFWQEKQGFIALVDFKQSRKDYPKYRKLQLQALKETGTKYVVLEGKYKINEIRKIYRKCSMFFVAARESFGLPICELQACGAYIFTPYSEWASAHWLKEDLYKAGPGTLSPNFIVYNNSKRRLMAEIKHIKKVYNPEGVYNTFLANHPYLFYGNLAELKKFVQMVKKKKIHSNSHKKYLDLK